MGRGDGCDSLWASVRSRSWRAGFWRSVRGPRTARLGGVDDLVVTNAQRFPLPFGAVRAAMQVVALPVLGLLLWGCSAVEPEQPRVVRLFAPAWVGDAGAGWDPVAQPGVLFATGRAALQQDRAATARQAEDEARRQLEPRVRQALGRLHAAWGERHATRLDPAQLEALRADDEAARAVIASTLGGARLKGQWEDDQAFFAWLGLDTLAVLQPAFEADLSARLAPLARELTPADRGAFRQVLVDFVAELAAP